MAKRYSVEELESAFATFSEAGRPLDNLLNAKKPNTAKTYKSQSIRDRSRRTAAKRAKLSVGSMWKLAGRA